MSSDRRGEKLLIQMEGFASPLCLRQIHPQVLEEGDFQIYTLCTVQAEVPMTVKVIYWGRSGEGVRIFV